MKIVFTANNGKQYTLEYTRRALTAVDKFKDKIEEDKDYALTVQFHVGLMKNHPEITIEESEALREEIMDKELAEEIAKMVSNALPETREKPKNARWKVAR